MRKKTLDPAKIWLALTQKRFFPAVLTGIFLLAVTYLFWFDPAHYRLYPSCPFYFLTGFYCPGCGTLRALHQLLHGRLLAAFRYNPLTVLVLPFLIYAAIRKVTGLLTGRRLPQIYIRSVWIWVVFVVVLGFWILRNIPVYPFTMLAPRG
jgi:hypothetical protein